VAGPLAPRAGPRRPPTAAAQIGYTPLALTRREVPMSRAYAQPATAARPTSAPAIAAPTAASALGSNQDQLGLLAQAVPTGQTGVLDAAARDVPTRPDPTPWAAQQRSVQFRDVPGGSLFRNGPAPTDVVQGQNGARYLGDCWMLSSLAAVAHTQPQQLQDAIRDNGDGTYTVTLHTQGRDGSIQAEPVRVDGDVPMTADGRDAYAQRQDPKELWVVLMQKAFASKKGGYGAMDGGVPGEALTAVTGRRSHHAYAANDPKQTLEALRRASAGGTPTVAASRADIQLKEGGIVPGHGHTVLGTEVRDGQEVVLLRDPFAKYEPSGNGPRDGIFRVPVDTFAKSFSYVAWTDPAAGEQQGAGPTAPAP
jgi:hypothetical protein